jgi:uncharacterized protein YecE (DUF72 family)
VTVWVGTSGWSYQHWDGVLYPAGTPTARRLEHYVAAFDTVELNASFYRWPRPVVFAGWRERLPTGFRMSVKAPRGLTHARRLRDPEVWVERMAPGLEALADRFAVLLVQLPPDLERDDGLLEGFLAALPRWVPVAVELRHPTWQDEDVFALLAGRGAAYVVMSGAHLPCILRATAPFVYVRLHGPSPEHLYAGSYPAPDLDWWAERFREWDGAGLEVYGYCNNDGGGNAVRDARGLLQRLT